MFDGVQRIVVFDEWVVFLVHGKGSLARPGPIKKMNFSDSLTIESGLSLRSAPPRPPFERRNPNLIKQSGLLRIAVFCWTDFRIP